MPTEFRTRLAGATRAAHQAIEDELALEADVPLERYIAYLQAMHAVVAPFEAVAAGDASLAALGLRARRKRPSLEQDLAHFHAAPLRHHAPPPQGRAARVGWAYVLEGSTLGGRVLYRRLAPRWALSRVGGGAFLWGYGEATAAMWLAFVEALNAMPFDEQEAQACIASATQAFEAIGCAFRASVSGADLGICR